MTKPSVQTYFIFYFIFLQFMVQTCFVERDPLRSAALVEVIEHVLVTGQKPGERGGHPDCDAGADRLYPRSERATAREHQPTRQPHSGGLSKLTAHI